LVNVIVVPLVRPKYRVPGWSPNGTTVRVLFAYAPHAPAM
jgi:hypothetical protein